MKTPSIAPELSELAAEALAAGGRREGFLPFLLRHIHPRPRESWTLEGHEYLRGIAEDESQIIVVEKAAQLGLSTLFLAELLYVCLGGHNAGYFLDTAGRMQRMVQARLDPIIDADEELTRQVLEGRMQLPGLSRRRRGKIADNVRIKQIGPATAYFLSTQVMGDVKTVDLDAIYMDEVAELDEEKSEFAQDRLLHSNLKLQRWISQPDVPGMDIDDWFQRSNQQYYQLRCGRCRQWWALELSFPDCLFQVRGEWRIGCPKCHVQLHRESGEWIARHPDRPISGYHLSQLYGPRISAAEIAAAWERAQTRPSRMRRFYLSILGLPWAGERQPITDMLLNERCGDWALAPSASAVPGAAFAGIDTGDTLHLVIARFDPAGPARIVWLERLADWDLLARRLRDHQVEMFVCDAAPEKTKAKELCRALGGGAIVYSSGRRTAYSIEDQETEPVHAISVDRTEMIDGVVDAITAGELWLPKPTLEEAQVAREHLKRLVKDRDDSGNYRYRRNIENHYAMAAAHMMLAHQSQAALRLAPAGHFTGEHAVSKNIAEPPSDRARRKERDGSSSFFRREVT